MDNLKNIDINIDIDMIILENIDINIDIDLDFHENIDMDIGGVRYRAPLRW